MFYSRGRLRYLDFFFLLDSLRPLSLISCHYKSNDLDLAADE